MTFAAEFASARPDEVAARDARHVLSWAQVDDVLRAAVHVLRGLDTGPSRRVAILAENSVETLLAHAAATLAGLSVVPVNFHLTAAEVAYLLTDSGAQAVLVDGRTAAVGRAAADEAGVDAVLGWDGVAAVPGVADWDALLGAAPETEPPTDHPPLPTLVYTSGTTGRPKGVELPPTSFVGGDDVAEHLRRLRSNRMLAHGRHLVVGPMYHSGPLAGTRLFLGGAPVTVLGRFDAEAVLAAVDRDAIGSAIMVPTHFQRLLALPAEARARHDVSSLRYVLQVGAKCPEPVKRAMIDWWGPVVWESYGASEVGTTCVISAEDWLAHPGSVGRPVPPFEVMVLDEHDRPVAAGVEGRLYFRDTTGRGIVYHQGLHGAGSELGPGVFTLGEIGYVDEDGFVYVTDRFSDMVVSGGVNIYPAEAEQVLATHPSVADVACIGVPDRDMGERLKALVVPVSEPPSGADLVEFCRARLAHYKCPREVEIVTSLRRTAVGKIDKRALRRAHAGGAPPREETLVTGSARPGLDEFRAQARAFLAGVATRRTGAGEERWGTGDDRVTLFRGATAEEAGEARAWRRAVFDAGFGWLTGPVELGGRGLPGAYERAYLREERAFDTPSRSPLGVSLGMVAPTLRQFGGEAAVTRWLRALYRGDSVGCQLFSEPGAGSDLAAVSTRAVRRGDEWVVTGQKVWTSGAHYSDVGLLLARTSAGPRHRNLTAFVIDMRAPGVEVRPLRQMTGGADFNEVFLTGVVVPDAYRLGEVDGGWRVAMATLMYERGAIGGSAGGGNGLFRMDRVVAMLHQLGRAGDPEVRQAYARLHAGVVAAKQLRARAEVAAKDGRVGTEMSLSKLALTQNLAALAHLVSVALGPKLLADTGEWGTFAWTEFVLGVPGFRLGGGTDEIQRNIVAERVLGLPK
ncbi:AMP-binding protein [Actinophytocola sp.]|uniref:AMP-binding protein n=1 Tax=Actinophytocola sp. TaxID=1872138 RepID=UPI002EDA4573